MCYSCYALLFDVVYIFCGMSVLIEKQEKEQKQQEGAGEGQIQGIPVCGGNLSSPVVDQAHYIEEIHYTIGNRMYIENAD
jgi:hypothetical protein